MSRAEAPVARIDERTARVVVVGQGYVGLPVALWAAAVGFPVVGFDVAAERVAALAAGRSYVADVSDEELAYALRTGYRPTATAAEIGGFDVAVITVPTPPPAAPRSWSGPSSSGRACAPARTSSSASRPSASTRATRTGPGQHAQGGVGDRRGLAARRRRELL